MRAAKTGKYVLEMLFALTILEEDIDRHNTNYVMDFDADTTTASPRSGKRKRISAGGDSLDAQTQSSLPTGSKSDTPWVPPRRRGPGKQKKEKIQKTPGSHASTAILGTTRFPSHAEQDARSQVVSDILHASLSNYQPAPAGGLLDIVAKRTANVIPIQSLNQDTQGPKEYVSPYPIVTAYKPVPPKTQGMVAQETPIPLIDTLPKSKQRQIYALMSGLQGGIDNLQKQMNTLQAVFGIDTEDVTP